MEACAQLLLLLLRLTLLPQDFERIRKLKQKALVEAALVKHGLSSGASKAKKTRLLEAAEEDAAEALALRTRLAAIGESKVHAQDLVGEYGTESNALYGSLFVVLRRPNTLHSHRDIWGLGVLRMDSTFSVGFNRNPKSTSPV